MLIVYDILQELSVFATILDRQLQARNIKINLTSSENLHSAM